MKIETNKTTTVSINIDGELFSVTEEEAKELYDSIGDALGLNDAWYQPISTCCNGNGQSGNTSEEK